MDHRTEIIVKEIYYWKQNKLLPAEYCNFLLALYTEGEEITEEASTNRIESNNNPLVYGYVSVILMLVPFSFLVIYFTELGIILQTGLLSLFVGIAFIAYRYVFCYIKLYIHFSILILLFLLLLLTVHVAGYWGATNFIVYVLVGAHCIFWFLLGRLKQYRYLQALSLLVLVILGITIVL
ncbi:hypothetical protein [Halobacillus seohaensis]|uniref:DUF1700 domain-containing protein n=1 Tax=Halobacillus seohaensis TaxID=447421 RepID=A0ABW2EET6_9BACI